MRVKITEIGPRDAYSEDEDLICGQIGEISNLHDSLVGENAGGFVGGWVKFVLPEFIKDIENSGAINEDTLYFCQIKIQDVS